MTEHPSNKEFAHSDAQMSYPYCGLPTYELYDKEQITKYHVCPKHGILKMEVIKK